MPLLSELGVFDAATRMVQFILNVCSDGEGPRDEPHPRDPGKEFAVLVRIDTIQKALETGSFIGTITLKSSAQPEAQLRYEQYRGGELAGLRLKDFTAERHQEQGVVWRRGESGVYVPSVMPEYLLPFEQGATLPDEAFVARLATLVDRATQADGPSPLTVTGYPRVLARPN